MGPDRTFHAHRFNFSSFTRRILMKFAGGNRYHQQMNWGVFNSSPVEQAVPMGGPMLDRSAVGQLSSLSSRTKWQRLFYWIRMKVVQQLTCRTGRPNGPAYSTGELLNTPLITFWAKLYQGQESRTRQKIRINVKTVLSHSGRGII